MKSPTSKRSVLARLSKFSILAVLLFPIGLRALLLLVGIAGTAWAQGPWFPAVAPNEAMFEFVGQVKNSPPAGPGQPATSVQYGYLSHISGTKRRSDLLSWTSPERDCGIVHLLQRLGHGENHKSR